MTLPVAVTAKIDKIAEQTARTDERVKTIFEHYATKEHVTDRIDKHEDDHHKKKNSIIPRPTMSPREKAAWGLLTAVAMSGGFWMWLS